MKFLMRSLIAGLLLLGTRSAFADTLKFIFSDQPGYPFQMQVNGSSAITNLMCLDINRRVTYNEVWNVDVLGVPLDNSATSIQYRADAWIFSLLGGKYSNGDLQYAAWSIFDQPDTQTAGGWTSTVQALNTLAYQKAQDQILISSGFFSGFRLYLPNANTTGWTAGTPQRYIGAAAVAVTPEPESLVLMLTGALCIGCGIVYRKRFSQGDSYTAA